MPKKLDLSQKMFLSLRNLLYSNDRVKERKREKKIKKGKRKREREKSERVRKRERERERDKVKERRNHQERHLTVSQVKFAFLAMNPLMSGSDFSTPWIGLSHESNTLAPRRIPGNRSGLSFISSLTRSAHVNTLCLQ